MGFILWTLALTALVAVVGGSLIGEPTPPLSLEDKLVHFLAYVVLTFLFLLAAVWSPVRGSGRFPRATILVVLGVTIVGAAVEVAQGLVPGRQPDVTDALADVLGSGVGLAMWHSLRALLAG